MSSEIFESLRESLGAFGNLLLELFKKKKNDINKSHNRTIMALGINLKKNRYGARRHLGQKNPLLEMAKFLSPLAQRENFLHGILNKIIFAFLEPFLLFFWKINYCCKYIFTVSVNMPKI